MKKRTRAVSRMLLEYSISFDLIKFMVENMPEYKNFKKNNIQACFIFEEYIYNNKDVNVNYLTIHIFQT